MKLRKLVSILMAFAMTLGMLSLGAAREAKADGEIELGTLAEVVAALGDSARTSLGTQTYKLTANVSVGTTANGGSNLYVIAGENITLDLAGHRLRSTAFRNFIAVQGGATFNLIDSVGGGSLEAYYNATSTNTSTSRAVYLSGDGSTFNLISGTVKGYVTNGTYNGYSAKATLKGNLIYAGNGTAFNMSGGTVTECPPLDVTSTNGGMIYLGNGTHTISGGTVSNGISNHGGNILLNGGTLTVGGGAVITGGNGRYGGNIRVNADSTLYLNDCTVSDGVSSTIYGTGPSGSNLYVAGTIVINGAVISGNPATNANYSIYLRSGSDVTVEDAAIDSNINNEGILTINGGSFSGRVNSNTADGVLTVNGGTFTGNINKTATSSVTASDVIINGGFFAAQQPQADVTALGSGKYATGECVDAPAEAPYTVDDSETYTVSYKLPDSTEVATAQTVAHGTKVTISDYTPASGTFGGWYYDADLTKAAPAAGDEVEFSKDTTLYAWVTTATLYDITVNIDGVEDTTLSGTYAEGSTFALPAGPEVPYFTFDGYSTTDGGAVEYAAGDTYTVNAGGTVNFYTKYTEAARNASFTSGGTTVYTHDADDFNTAFNAIDADTDIVMLADITNDQRPGTVAQTEGNEFDVTFDMNGFRYTYTGNARGFFVTRAYCTLTVSDSIGTGEFISNAVYSSTQSFFYTNTNGYVVVESGKFTGTYTGSAHDIGNARVTLNGGVFDQDPSACINAGTHEVVPDTPSAGLYTVQQRSQVVYAATLTVNGGEPVSYTRYEDALAAASAVTEENAVIRIELLGDTLDSSMNIGFPSGCTLTIDLGGYTLTRTNVTRAFSFRGLTATVKNGTFVAPSGAYTAGNGGFARIYDDASGNASTVTFEDLVIDGFKATVSGTTKRNGGAVCLEAGSTLNIVRGAVNNCHADGNGGAIYAIESSTVNINGTTFGGNNAGGNAGAIFARATTLTISNATFTGCSAALAGAILLERNNGIISTADLTAVTFDGCSATGDGGALYISSACVLTADSQTKIKDCSAKNGAAAFLYVGTSTDSETGAVTYYPASVLSFNGTIENSASSGEGFGNSTAPIYSKGCVYLNDVLTTDGDVYQDGKVGRFSAIGAAITDTVTAALFVDIAGTDDTTDPIVVCYNNAGNDVEVAGAAQTGGRYRFDVTLNVNRIADVIELQVKQGTSILATYSASILENYFNVLATGDSLTADQKTFVANLIVFADLLQEYAYGQAVEEAQADDANFDPTDAAAAAQLAAKAGADVTVPVWADAAKTDAEPTAADNVRNITRTAGTDAEKDAIKTANLNIAERISLRFRFIKQDTTDIVVLHEGAPLTEGTDFEIIGDKVCINRFNPDFYDDVYKVQLRDSATDDLIQEITYSVNSYCFAKKDSNEVGGIAKAIYNYGLSAAALNP